MEFISTTDIWPGKGNGVMVKKTNSCGSKYVTIIYKEEYELECMLHAIEQEGITSLEQFNELCELITKYGDLKYSQGADSNID